MRSLIRAARSADPHVQMLVGPGLWSRGSRPDAVHSRLNDFGAQPSEGENSASNPRAAAVGVEADASSGAVVVKVNHARSNVNRFHGEAGPVCRDVRRKSEGRDC